MCHGKCIYENNGCSIKSYTDVENLTNGYNVCYIGGNVPSEYKEYFKEELKNGLIYKLRELIEENDLVNY